MTHPLPHSTLLQRAPMLVVAVCMIVGILLAEWCPSIPVLYPCLMGLAGIAVMVVSQCIHSLHRLFSVGEVLTFVMIGTTVTQLHAPQDPFNDCDSVPPAQLSMRVKETPRLTARGCKVVAELDSVGETAARCRVMLFLPHDSLSLSLLPGDRLHVQASLRRPSTEDNPHQFDYRRYLRHRGILWQCYANSAHWQLASLSHQRYAPALWQRQLVARLRSYHLSPSEQGISEALLLGWRDDVDDATQQQFRQSGITHLLCVSGLHVGVLALIVGALLFFLGKSPWQRVLKGILQMMAIWAYVVLTGMAPSTMRAGVMISLMLIGNMIGQRSASLNYLATSAVLLLCIQPGMLFDVGFQLSYVAVLGILFFHPPLFRLIPALADPERSYRLWLPAKIWEWTCLSTSAQLATLPLVLHYFHQFPIYFLIANLTIVPFAGLLLATALLLVLSGGWSWVTWMLHAELSAVDGLTRWVASLPSALVDNIYCDMPMTILLTLTLVLLVVLLRRRQLWALPSMLGCLLLMMMHLVMVNHHATRQCNISVYQAGKHLAIECFDGRQSYLICDSSTASNPSLIDYQREGMLLYRRVQQTVVLSIDTMYSSSRCAVMHHCILFGGNRILVIDRNNSSSFRPYADTVSQPLPLHFSAVIVAPNTWVDTSKIRKTLQYDTLLFHYGYTQLRCMND